MRDALRMALYGAAKSVRPPPVLRLSEWAQENVRLPAETSAVSGRYRPWKYQRLILDAIGDPLVERVTMVKATRTGFTRMLVTALAADAANDPCPVMLLMPTDDDCRGIVVDEIDPTFRESPSLAGLMAIGRFDGRNTLTQRRMLGGGSLKILAARSPRNLRRHTVRKLYCDEVDAMEITREGDPIKLATKRTESYGDRKIIIGSTPTEDGVSNVQKSWEESDQRIFEVPCPHCDERFELLWDNVEWTGTDPDTAHAVCPHCGTVIEEKYKTQMVEAGDFRITRPEVKSHAGFRVNALVSLQPQARWGQLVREYLEAKRAGPSGLQVFYNTVLALPWSTALDMLDAGTLQGRAEDFGICWSEEEGRWIVSIPEEVLYITAGVDVQPDRLEVGFWGWSENQLWSLGHEVIRGATNLETTWAALDAMLSTVWKHPLGGEIGIEAAAVDSGDGNRTQQVYDFCGPRSMRGVYAIKGREGPIPVMKAMKSRRSRRSGAAAYIVGVDQVKMDLLSRAAVERGQPGAIRFSRFLAAEWFEQFTSERRVAKPVAGRMKVRFERIGYRAAEALDCAVYAVAVRTMCRFNFEARRRALTMGPPPEATRPLKDKVRRLHGL